jgi:predicted acyl esterase
VQEVKVGEVYEVDVEVWPINVVLDEGETLVFEIARHDTQGMGKFSHDHPKDRKTEILDRMNEVHVGGDRSWLLLPVIPPRQ